MITPLISCADDGISTLLLKYFIENRVNNKITTWIITDTVPYGEDPSAISFIPLGTGDDLSLCYASDFVKILVINSLDDDNLKVLLSDLSISIVWNLDLIEHCEFAKEESISSIKARLRTAPQDIWSVFDYQFRHNPRALDFFYSLFNDNSSINAIYCGYQSCIAQKLSYISPILIDNSGFYFENISRTGIDDKTVYLQGVVLIEEDVPYYSDIKWQIVTADLDYIVNIPRRWRHPNLEDNFKNLVS